MSQPDKYADNLAKMIRCETVTIETGGKPEAFDRLHEQLRAGYPLIFSKLELVKIMDKSLLLVWRGRKPASTEPAILMAHQDVVEATGSWRYPPFSGTIAEGRVWGRGAIDDKGCLCAILEAVEKLLADGYTPDRDFYIAMSHNEEQMGDGAPAIVDWLKKNEIKPGFVLDEGGAVVDNVFPGIQGSTAMIGTGEKGYLTVRFTAFSKGGHASTPGRNTPLSRLAAMINRIERKPPFPAKLNPVTREMFTALSPRIKGALKFVTGNLWLFAPVLPAVLRKVGGEAGAMVTTTCAFTMAKGSGAQNVLPEEASVTANLRVAVHQTVDEVYIALKEIAEEYDIKTDVLYCHEPTPFSSLESQEARPLTAAVAEIFPKAPAAPYIMMAASDSHHFSQICQNIYKFTPFYLTKELRQSIHGIDENLPVEDLARAVNFYETLIIKLR